MLVIDMGDYVVVQPRLADPLTALQGIDKGRGPSTDEMRRADRQQEWEAYQRKARVYGLPEDCDE